MRGREIQRQTKRNCQTKGNKSKKWYLTYIRGRQKCPISQKKMKNFVFSDNFHQIIYIILVPFSPVPRPLYPHSPPRHPPLYPHPPPPLPPYPRPPVHPPFATWSFEIGTVIFFYRFEIFLPPPPFFQMNVIDAVMVLLDPPISKLLALTLLWKKKKTITHKQATLTACCPPTIV